MKVKPPFEPSALALAAGAAALEDTHHLEKTLDLTAKALTFFYDSLDRLQIDYLTSAANFVTTIWESESEAERINREALERGIILRNLKPFGWPECIRISVGLQDENQKCVEALAAVL